MDSDSALRLLGRYSKWQMIRYLTYAIGFGLPYSWMYLSMVFIGDTPSYHCAVPANVSLNESIPRIYNPDGTWQWSQCTQFENPYSQDNSTVPCKDGYWYDPASGYESTLVTEFDLVCGSNWLVELSMSVGALGSAVGGLIFPRMADMYGRRRIFLLCTWTNVIVAIIMAFSPSFTFFGVFSFIDGVQQQGMLATSTVLAMELFPVEERTFAGTVMVFFWSFGFVALCPIAYFLRNWRHLQLAISLPLLLTFTFYWLVSESIPWLIANKRYAEAEKIMQKAAKTNGITLPQQIFSENLPLESEEKLNADNDTPVKKKKLWHGFPKPNYLKTKSSSMLEVFKSKWMGLYTVILCFIWFVNSMVYYALSVTVTYLPGDRYLNFFLYGVTEIPSILIGWLLLYKVGRRYPLSGFHILAGISLILLIIQNYDLQPLIIVLSALGKFCITCTFNIVYVATIEIFPTNLRSTGLGVCMVFSRIGSYISPYARTVHRSLPWLPPVIMGSLSVVAGLLTLLLPETRHTRLPDTIEEVEQWRREQKHHSKFSLWNLMPKPA